MPSAKAKSSSEGTKPSEKKSSKANALSEKTASLGIKRRPAEQGSLDDSGPLEKKRRVQNSGPACTYCSQRRVKCDRKSPCQNCVKKGRAHDCLYKASRKSGAADESSAPSMNPMKKMQFAATDIESLIGKIVSREGDSPEARAIVDKAIVLKEFFIEEIRRKEAADAEAAANAALFAVVADDKGDVVVEQAPTPKTHPPSSDFLSQLEQAATEPQAYIQPPYMRHPNTHWSHLYVPANGNGMLAHPMMP